MKKKNRGKFKIKEYTFKQIYDKARELFKKNGIECYNSDALWLFSECFKLNRKDLLLKGNENARIEDYNRFLEMINKRMEGIPIQYILGSCEFMGISLDVGKGVLIPRDDTEVLVSETIKILKDKIKQTKKVLKVIDLCSGTGAISIAIKKTLGNSVEVTAIELYDEAFKYLEKNVYKNNLDIKIIKDNIYNCYNKFKDKEIDCIVSNPPYIPSKDIKNLDDIVKKEPFTALDGGKDGLEFYREICKKWLVKINENGFISLEIGIGQSEEVLKLLNSYNFKNGSIYKDINNIPRAIICKR